MTEPDFTNREIKAMFDGIIKTQESHGETHKEILTAVKITNGKVADIQAWRERVNGGSIVLSLFMTTIFIPIVGWMVYTMLHMDDMIARGISDALTEYQENITP